MKIYPNYDDSQSNEDSEEGSREDSGKDSEISTSSTTEFQVVFIPPVVKSRTTDSFQVIKMSASKRN